MTIRRLHTILVAAQDVPGCADFYRAALGLEVKFADGERWVQLRGPEISYAIACPDEAAPLTSGALAVFEATEEEDHDRVLAANGREVASRDMGDHGRTRTYADPAGNLFQLFWRA